MPDTPKPSELPEAWRKNRWVGSKPLLVEMANHASDRRAAELEASFAAYPMVAVAELLALADEWDKRASDPYMLEHDLTAPKADMYSGAAVELRERLAALRRAT